MRLSSIFVVIALTAGCAGSPFARLQNAERLPPDGSQGGPGANALALQMLAPDEWARAPKEKIAATCDARPGGKVDAAGVDSAKKVIGAWTAFQKAKPKPAPKGGVTVGQLAGMAPDNTHQLSAIAINCAAGAPSTLEVNGTAHGFDMAWIVAGKATSPTVNSQASVMAVSLKDKKIVFARVAIPNDPKNDSEELILVTNVANYFPENPDEPVVRNTQPANSDPTFETLLFAKGTTEGFYYLVPRSADLSLGKFLSVGRFKVGNPP